MPPGHRGSRRAPSAQRRACPGLDSRSLPRAAAPASEAEATNLSPGLYIVATPIGNLGDISLRGLDVLRRADTIVCEDTRVTATLARRYGLVAERVAYHDHNAEAMRPKLIARL